MFGIYGKSENIYCGAGGALGQSCGGTVYTVEYAKKNGLTVINLA